MDDNSIQDWLLSSKAEQAEGDLKRRIFEESKKIWRVATPSVIFRVSAFGTVVVAQSFIGHINSSDLSGYALVQSLSVKLVNGILLGMSSATETLCGQAFGAKQYHMMGIYLQRSWLIDLITLTILLPFFIFATPIFNLLGEEADVAKSTGYISMWFIPQVYGTLFTFTIQMYLQAQQKNMIIAWLSALQLVIDILLSWLFVIVLDFGTPGAMSALCISTWFVVLGEFVYVLGGWCPETWKGFTIAATKDLLPVVKLSISSGLMVCVRVANELGRGDAKVAKFSIKVILCTSSIIGVFFWILCLVFREKIGYLFTNEEEVAETISDLSVLLAFTVLLGSFFPVLSGVAVGAGLQTKVAVINLVCFYLIGLPIGAVLGYTTHLQVKGVWIGLTCGIVTQTLSLIFMVWRTNWDEEVSKTSERLQRWYLESSDENKQSSDHA